jgi:hypothetical protein
MIPWLLKVHIGGPNKKDRKIWIPLPLIYILVFILTIILSPLLIIAAIVLLIIKGINLFKAIPALIRLLAASSGFLIDVNTPDEKFLIDIK